MLNFMSKASHEFTSRSYEEKSLHPSFEKCVSYIFVSTTNYEFLMVFNLNIVQGYAFAPTQAKLITIHS